MTFELKLFSVLIGEKKLCFALANDPVLIQNRLKFLHGKLLSIKTVNLVENRLRLCVVWVYVRALYKRTFSVFTNQPKLYKNY